MAGKIEKVQEVSSEKNIGMAVLAYFGILVLIPLLTEAKNDPFVQFHIVQGLGLLIFGVAIGMVMIVPFLGWIIGAVAAVFYLVCWIMGIINAATGKEDKLPLIGDLAIKYIKI